MSFLGAVSSKCHAHTDQHRIWCDPLWCCTKRRCKWLTTWNLNLLSFNFTIYILLLFDYIHPNTCSDMPWIPHLPGMHISDYWHSKDNVDQSSLDPACQGDLCVCLAVTLSWRWRSWEIMSSTGGCGWTCLTWRTWHSSFPDQGEWMRGKTQSQDRASRPLLLCARRVSEWVMLPVDEVFKWVI